jgi:hypothetical protein
VGVYPVFHVESTIFLLLYVLPLKQWMLLNNMITENNMYKYSLKFFTLILALLICGCATRLPTYIKEPVFLNKAGTIIDMDFRVKRDYRYSMILDFFYTKDGKYEYGVGYNEEREKLKTLMGDSSYYDKNGNQIIKNVGVPIPIKLTVTSLLDNKIIYQTTIVPHLGSWGSGRARLNYSYC